MNKRKPDLLPYLSAAASKGASVNSIRLQNISKKFGEQKIFTGISMDLNQGDNLAITGYNGSGKSTLLQIMTGYVTPSAGQCLFFIAGQQVPAEQLYTKISLAAPYLELMEELTALETIHFYRQFKDFPAAVSGRDFLEMAQLGRAAGKQIRFFSSGMKQRLKLALAILSETPFLFLDEPVSNLDKPGIQWFHDLLDKYRQQRILVISSNEIQDEINCCNRFIRIEDFKK